MINQIMVTKLELLVLARKYKKMLVCGRSKSCASIRDIMIVVNDYVYGNGYDATFLTRLYRLHGGEYCSLLTIISCDLNLYPTLPINLGGK
jgi:hypothetical protein